jgi:tetratricopeptide (TPR) repeat protein
MKKILSVLLAAMMIVSCMLSLSACGPDNEGNTETESNVNSEIISQIVIHIESNESSKALSKCQSLNAETLEAGKDTILVAIKQKLNYCISHATYKSSTYWVNEKTIDELKNYQGILDLLPLEDSFTNAVDFVNEAVKLEKFIKWNAYSAEEDNYLQEVQYYLDKGASYRNTSWKTAVTYYEKALTVCRNAAIAFSDEDNYGYKETADFYNAYGTLIYNIINDKDTTANEENEFNRAKEGYLRINQEYIDALDEYIKILEKFPSKIY